jgi:hypothetical protein
VVSLLVPEGEPVVVAIDDTLFRRRGKKVWAASWFHDGSAAGPAKTGYGNNSVIAAIVVRLPFLNRPVAFPVLAKLVIKDTTSASRLWLARRAGQTRRDHRIRPGHRHPVRQDGNPADIGDRRSRAPWYATKTQPSTADVAVKLRGVIIAARFRPSRPDQPRPEEISTILAWEDLAA